jgi:serine/threonine protein kinase
MTKDKYLDMCDQLNKEPEDHEMPPELTDFPLDVQKAVIVFNKLGDKILADIGYLGKDYTLLEYLKYNNPSEKKNIQKYKSIYCSLKAAQEAIHKAGFVHRDIKPANIFVVHERSGIYKCKLIDFGFTVPLGTEGATAGSLNYMPKSLHTRIMTRAKKSHNDYSVETIWNTDFLFKQPPPDCSAASGPPLPPVNENSNSNTNSNSKTRRSSRRSRSSNRE